MKNVNYNVRLNPEIKSKAEETFAMFGMNLSDAINIFLHKSIMENGLPFEVRERRPNARLLAAMEETEQVLKEYEDGTRTPKPVGNIAEWLQEIIDEENNDDV